MDELGALILGERPKEKGSDIIAPNKSRNTGKNPQLQPEPDRPDELGNLILGSAPAPTQQALQKPSSFRGNVAEALTKAFQMKQAMPATAASGLDVLAGGISGLAQLPGYVAGRAFGLSDVEAERAASKVPQQLAQPIGRMTGMAQTPAYQQAFPTQAAEKFGQVVQQNVVEPIAERTGLSPIDVGQGVNAAMLAAPMAARPIARGLAEAKAALPTVRVETVKPSGMQSGGAAATTNKATLDAALAEIKDPELKAQLAKENPANIDPKVLQRYVDADSVGVKLFKGQASGDPNLISY